MEPKYPHRDPAKMPKDFSKMENRNPKGADINEIPNLALLVSHVNSFLELGNVKAKPQVDLTAPGAVLVLANGTSKKAGFEFKETADVLNGDVRSLKDNHSKWVDLNKIKNSADDPTKLHGADGNVVGTAALGENGGGTNGQWDKVKRRILINAHYEKGGMLVHEYLHSFDIGEPSEDFGWAMDEGIVEFFALDLVARYPGSYEYTGNYAYYSYHQCVAEIIKGMGYDKLLELWFERPEGLVKPLAGKFKALSKHVHGQPGDSIPKGSERLIEEICETANGLPGWKARAKSPAV